MRTGKNLLEKIKNVILVVLFLSTILLLYLLWSDGSRTSLRLSDILPFSGSGAEAPSVSDVLQPAFLISGSGDGSFSVDRSDMAGHLEKALQALRILSAEDISLGTVSAGQCRTALDSYPSSVLVFRCGIPYGDFCEIFGLEGLGTEAINYVSRILISEAAPDSVILMDDEKGVFYRIAADGILLTPDSADPAACESGVFYSADQILGCEGDVLIPMGESSSLALCSEVDLTPDISGADAARTVFGDTFDFVRRMADSFGTVTYMYGYGEKTLTVYSDGSFVYRAEGSGEDKGFAADLETALEFVENCGGWTSGDGISYQLSRYTSSGSGRNVSRRFYFSAFLDGIQLCSDDSFPLVVGVSGGEADYYFRSTVAAEKAVFGEETAVIDAANLIARNASLIYKVVTGSALAQNTDASLSYVAENLEDISIGYYHASGSHLLVPCRILTLKDGNRFYFGLYDGTLLGLSQ